MANQNARVQYKNRSLQNNIAGGKSVKNNNRNDITESTRKWQKSTLLHHQIVSI